MPPPVGITSLPTRQLETRMRPLVDDVVDPVVDDVVDPVPPVVTPGPVTTITDDGSTLIEMVNPDGTRQTTSYLSQPKFTESDFNLIRNAASRGKYGNQSPINVYDLLQKSSEDGEMYSLNRLSPYASLFYQGGGDREANKNPTLLWNVVNPATGDNFSWQGVLSQIGANLRNIDETP
jgi:hypothetical protein